MATDVFKKISQQIQKFEPEMIQLQADLTAIPALGPENGGAGEIDRANFVKTYLQPLKPDYLEEIQAPDARVPAGYRPNLIVRFRGKSQARTIWIMSHLDIVPPGELSQWKSDPYTLRVADGKIYGRGVEDNQQGLVGSIFAIKAFKALDILPEYDVGLAIVADEETGSRNGLHYVLQTRPELFQRDDLIIVPDYGVADGTLIEVAEKSILWLKFQVLGKQCHGSTPALGINAHKAGANLIVRLNALYQKYNIVDPVFDPPISTFEPTKKEANIPNINTIPGEDVFYFDCRVLPQYNLKEVEGEIQRIIQQIETEFGVQVNLSSPQKEQAAPGTPINAPVVVALQKAIAHVYQRQAKTIGIGGGTVAAFFRRAGFHAAVWSTMEEVGHQPNEYCVISNMINDTQVFAHIFTQQDDLA
ncbi:M20 family metallo-hydrolase [candidate division KSB1 bacterium]|nr:M20 family metallo-hydrolase [candidate division KSB1 bacterium]